MRYTTIIDISDMKQIYQSEKTRLVYLHLALKAGYHDNDRDIADISIRRLAMEARISISATRHALKVLERSGLLSRQGNAWLVKKWIMTEEISPRAKSKRQQRQLDAIQERKRQSEQRELTMEAERLEREQLAAQGKSSFILYVEALKKKADSGDIEAAAAFKRHEAAYNEAIKKINQK